MKLTKRRATPRSFAPVQGAALFGPESSHSARRLMWGIMVAVPFLYGLLALVLGQDANWDFRNYHWYNAYALVTGRYTSDILPSQTPFFYNPTLDIPFYLLASHVSARVAGFVLAFFQGLNFPLLFALAHAVLRVPNQRRRVLIAAAIAGLGVLGGGGIAQIGASFYDNVTSLGLFVSILLLFRSWDRLYFGSWTKAGTAALVAGVPAGLMMGLKLPSVVFCVGLCGALLFVSGTRERRFGLAFAYGLGVLAGGAVTMGHWAVFLNEHFGSPLFPYFNDIFKSPMGALTSARDTQFLPQSWGERLFFPFVFGQNPLRVGEIPWRDLRIPMLYALLPVALVLRLAFGRNKGAPDTLAEPYFSRYLLWAGALSYAVWLNLFAIYRYLLPLEMLAPLLIVLCVGMLPLRASTRHLVAAFLLGSVAMTLQGGDWGRHKPWLAHAVEVGLPRTPWLETPNVMLFMAGYEPYSHVLTAFPPAWPVIRLQSNFANPDLKIGLNDRIRERVKAHQGPYLMLIPAYHHELAKIATAAYDLTFLPQTCLKVDDKLYDSQLQLCEVTRNPPAKK